MRINGACTDGTRRSEELINARSRVPVVKCIIYCSPMMWIELVYRDIMRRRMQRLFVALRYAITASTENMGLLYGILRSSYTLSTPYIHIYNNYIGSENSNTAYNQNHIANKKKISPPSPFSRELR